MYQEIVEILDSNLHITFFNILNLLIIMNSILVIIPLNPIISVLYLISLFLCVSIYLILLGINFIGISYLLVYIGAVSILFLFILMLINIRISELQSENRNSFFLSVLLGLSFYLYLLNTSIHLDKNMKITSFNIFSDSTKYVTSNLWDSSLIESADIVSIGNILYTDLSIWLLISLLILLLAMVGCIVINISKK